MKNEANDDDEQATSRNVNELKNNKTNFSNNLVKKDIVVKDRYDSEELRKESDSLVVAVRASGSSSLTAAAGNSTAPIKTSGRVTKSRTTKITSNKYSSTAA